MFKISTKGDYGLLLMTALAQYYRSGRSFVSLKEVAEAKHLSLPYLSQIIVPLKQAGLVASKEGREGGYALAKAPNEISMMQVLEILEGPIAPVRCCNEQRGGCACGSAKYCNVKATWKQAQTMLAEFFKNKTLEDTLNT